MARSKRLTPILRLAEQREKNAAHSMAQARRRLNYYEEKLAELRHYRNEYGMFMQQDHPGAVSATQLREYQAFIHQLNEGITLLVEKIEGQRRIKVRGEEQWVSARKHTDTLDKLIVKIKWMERKFAANREANEIDERAARNSEKKL